MKLQVTAAIVTALLAGSAYAQTLVTVNGEKIDSSRIDEQVKLIQSESQGQVQDSNDLRAGLLNRMVTQTLVNQEAKRLKLDKSDRYKDALQQSQAAAKKEGADKKPEFKQQWASYERDLLSQSYMAHVVDNQPVKDEDAQKFYTEYKNRYQNSEEVRLSEIYLNSEADAKAVVNDLKKGKKFADLAKAKSIDPAAKQTGGAKDFMNLKDLEQDAPALFAAVGKLKQGQYSQPISAQNVWAVFRVDERRKATVPAFEQLKPAIVNQLSNERVNAAIGQLYQKADIKPAK